MFDENEHPRAPKGSGEGGRFTKKSSDGAGGSHEPTAAETKRLHELGIDKRRSGKSYIELPKQEYAELCSAIRTKYADKIPVKGQILYGDDYYQFRYNKRQERIVFTFKIRAVGNEKQVNYYLEKFEI